jgi:hypothetical protein
LNIIYTLIINLTFNTSLNYTNGCVIYRTSLVSKLDINSTGFFFQTELILRLIKSGYLYAEIPVFLNQRLNDESKAILPKSIISVMIDYFKTIYGIFISKNYLIEILSDSVTSQRSSNNSN